MGITIGLAIGVALSSRGNIAVELLGWSFWNELMSYLRCYTAKAGSQKFSSYEYLF